MVHGHVEHYSNIVYQYVLYVLTKIISYVDIYIYSHQLEDINLQFCLLQVITYDVETRALTKQAKHMLLTAQTKTEREVC